MSMVTLGDSIHNTGLGWLVSAKCEVDYTLPMRVKTNGKGQQAIAGTHRLMTVIGWLKQSNHYEWIATPFGFDHYEGMGGSPMVKIKIVEASDKQMAELALKSITQWGYWCHLERFNKMWPTLPDSTKEAGKGMLKVWARDNLKIEL